VSRAARGVAREPRCAAVVSWGAAPWCGLLVAGAASRTTLNERRRPLVISAPMLLAGVHPSWQYLLLDPRIG